MLPGGPVKAAFDPVSLVALVAAAITPLASVASERLRAIVTAVFRRPSRESTVIVHHSATDQVEIRAEMPGGEAPKTQAERDGK